VVMGEQPRWGEPLETVISAAEFTIHGLTPVSVPSQTGTPSRVDPHYRLSDRPFHDFQAGWQFRFKGDENAGSGQRPECAEALR